MQKIPILLMFLGHICVDTSQGILPVVLPKLKEFFDLSYFQVGLAVTVLNLTSSVIQPVFGYVSDRFRSGWFVPAGILWTAFAMGLLGWVHNYSLVLLLVGFAGLGTAAFHPRAMMAVTLVSGSRRGLGTAIFSTGGNLGFALGPVIGRFLVLGFGLHATMGLLAPAVLFTSAILLYPGDFLRREAGGGAGSRGALHEGPFPIPWRSLVALCLIVTLRSWVYMSFLAYLPMFLQDQGVHLKTGSLILTVFLACGAAAGLYGGHLSDRIGRRAVIVGSMLLYPALASLMMMSSGAWMWILAGVSGAALLSSFSVTIVWAQDLLPGRLGLASGLMLGLGFGMGGLGVALSGYLADLIGLYHTLWILALVPVLASLLAFLVKARADTP